MSSQISVVIPALNERESIGQVVASMPWSLIAECIVVDNGSTDGTGEVATAAGARVIASRRGYGAACKAGSDAALATASSSFSWTAMAAMSSLIFPALSLPSRPATQIS